jgi:hypothetical protein
MSELKDKIAEIIMDMTEASFGGAATAADAILAIPEIAEALALRAQASQPLAEWVRQNYGPAPSLPDHL